MSQELQMQEHMPHHWQAIGQLVIDKKWLLVVVGEGCCKKAQAVIKTV
jgi:hypothetical protein